MKIFVLLLTIWGTEDVPQVWALDTALSGEDCIQGMLDAANTAEKMGASLSCEFDLGEPWDE